MTQACKVCGKALCPDEVAVTRKLVNRGADTFFCVDCLAAYFDVTPGDIRERIAYFKKLGCTLFAPFVGEDKKNNSKKPAPHEKGTPVSDC